MIVPIVKYIAVNEGHESETHWYKLDQLLTRVFSRIEPSMWVNDHSLKYIGLRVDTRTMHALITDQHGNPIRVDQIFEMINQTKDT